MECPIDISEKYAPMLSMQSVREALEKKKIDVWICADDWCNTLDGIRDFVDAKAVETIQVKTPDLGGLNNSIEAAIYCKKNWVKAFIAGGHCP